MRKACALHTLLVRTLDETDDRKTFCESTRATINTTPHPHLGNCAWVCSSCEWRIKVTREATRATFVHKTYNQIKEDAVEWNFPFPNKTHNTAAVVATAEDAGQLTIPGGATHETICALCCQQEVYAADGSISPLLECHGNLNATQPCPLAWHKACIERVQQAPCSADFTLTKCAGCSPPKLDLREEKLFTRCWGVHKRICTYKNPGKDVLSVPSPTATSKAAAFAAVPVALAATTAAPPPRWGGLRLLEARTSLPPHRPRLRLAPRIT